MACTASSPGLAACTDHEQPSCLPGRPQLAGLAVHGQKAKPDLTYIPTGEGWLYMAAIMDLHTRKVVGWSMHDHLRAELATSALLIAIRRQRPEPALIQHSDRGVQYACTDHQEALQAAGITPSMSRRGNALDNAPMENFVHTLKTELVHQRAYAIHDEAKRYLFAYVEGFYNRKYLHLGLGYRTPAEAEQRAQSVA